MTNGEVAESLKNQGGESTGMKRITRSQLLRMSGAVALGAAGGALLAACGAQAGMAGQPKESVGTAKPAEAARPKGAPASPAKAADIPVKVGYLPITDSTPLILAYADYHYQNEGLKAEKPVLFRGWSQIAEAFMAEQVNLVHLLMPMTVWMRYSLKFPAKVVAWDHVNGSALTVHKDGGISSFKDLGGKQIAVPFWYSIHNVVLQMGLRFYGLEAVIQDRNKALQPHQVNLFVMAPPDMPTALGNKSIDGYIVAEPFNAAGEVLANGKIIRFTGDVWKEHACCVAVLSEKLIKENPEWAQRVLNAVAKAQLAALKDVPGTAKRLSKDDTGLLPFDAPIIERAMHKYDLETYGPKGTGAIRHPEWNQKRIGFQPYPYPSYTIELVKQLRQTRVEGDTSFLKDLSGDHAAEDLVNYDLVKSAYESAGGPSAFQVAADQAFKRTEVVAVE